MNSKQLNTIRQDLSPKARGLLRLIADRLADPAGFTVVAGYSGKGDDHLPFGAAKRGTLNLKKELRALSSYNYNGTITLEIFCHRRWLNSCAEWVREVWGELEG